ncbi:hypothetical protein BLNAU_14633 [Blattamonas nauphoetae]|uniref:Ferric oxidoreductase domain-containing protein n=1 Tax=Blattamonas nauphoetae TaxID=2049346 RepID=A0ABQ9XD09_9EUKA|nr:hypothetical protein BLNAU_14633 [Blattamonas nauphoetae]
MEQKSVAISIPKTYVPQKSWRILSRLFTILFFGLPIIASFFLFTLKPSKLDEAPPSLGVGDVQKFFAFQALTVFTFLLMTGAQIPWIERSISYSIMMGLHKWLTWLLFVLIFLHLFLMFFDPWCRNEYLPGCIKTVFYDFQWAHLTARLGSLLLVIVAAFAALRQLPRKKGCIPWRLWRVFHNFMYLAYFAVMIHVVVYGFGYYHGLTLKFPNGATHQIWPDSKHLLPILHFIIPLYLLAGSIYATVHSIIEHCHQHKRAGWWKITSAYWVADRAYCIELSFSGEGKEKKDATEQEALLERDEEHIDDHLTVARVNPQTDLPSEWQPQNRQPAEIVSIRVPKIGTKSQRLFKEGKHLSYDSPNIFTISSSRHNSTLQLLVRQGRGRFTGNLETLAFEGVPVMLSRPHSGLIPPFWSSLDLTRPGDDLVFIASGCGFSPALSVLRSAFDCYMHGCLARRIRILSINRNAREIMFPAEIRAIVGEMLKNEGVDFSNYPEFRQKSNNKRPNLVYGRPSQQSPVTGRQEHISVSDMSIGSIQYGLDVGPEQRRKTPTNSLGESQSVKGNADETPNKDGMHHPLSCIRFGYLLRDAGAVGELTTNETMCDWIPESGEAFLWEGELSPTIITCMIDTPKNSQFFICGDPHTVKRTKAILKEKPISASVLQIHDEPNRI